MRVSVCEQRWSPPCAAELCCPHARMQLLLLTRCIIARNSRSKSARASVVHHYIILSMFFHTENPKTGDRFDMCTHSPRRCCVADFEL